MAARALAGLRVIEYGRLIAAPFCAKLLADMGADVIKVEAPDGDPARRREPFLHDVPHPERSGLFLQVNTGKRGVTLDLDHPQGPPLLRRLLHGSDVFIYDRPLAEATARELDPETLHRDFPTLIVTVISPFGLSGPRRSWKGTDLIVNHAAGVGHHTPHAVEDLEAFPPLRSGASQGDFVAGLTAAIATMSALLGRRQSGRGQVVDVSAQEALVSTLRTSVASYIYAGQVYDRSAASRGPAAMIYWPCSNGYLRGIPAPGTQDRWERFVELIGTPEWALDERFRDVAGRTQHWEELRDHVLAWTTQRTKEEVYHALQSAGIPAFPANSAEDLFNWPQLQAREFFTEIDHPDTGRLRYPGAPYKFSATPPAIGRAPRLGEHNMEVYKGLGDEVEDTISLFEHRAI